LPWLCSSFWDVTPCNGVEFYGLLEELASSIEVLIFLEFKVSRLVWNTGILYH
jgi:hypothetical protein